MQSRHFINFICHDLVTNALFSWLFPWRMTLFNSCCLIFNLFLSFPVWTYQCHPVCCSSRKQETGGLCGPHARIHRWRVSEHVHFWKQLRRGKGLDIFFILRFHNISVQTEIFTGVFYTTPLDTSLPFCMSPSRSLDNTTFWEGPTERKLTGVKFPCGKYIPPRIDQKLFSAEIRLFSRDSRKC